MKTSLKPRNPHAISACNRKAGKLCSKRNRRLNGKNKKFQFLNEDY